MRGIHRQNLRLFDIQSLSANGAVADETAADVDGDIGSAGEIDVGHDAAGAGDLCVVKGRGQQVDTPERQRLNSRVEPIHHHSCDMSLSTALQNLFVEYVCPAAPYVFGALTVGLVLLAWRRFGNNGFLLLAAGMVCSWTISIMRVMPYQLWGDESGQEFVAVQRWWYHDSEPFARLFAHALMFSGWIFIVLKARKK